MEPDRFQPPVRSTPPHLSRTVESEEVDDLNHKLAGLGDLRHITAGELGLAETSSPGRRRAHRPTSRRETIRLCCEGPEGFPYVYRS